ncbi:hypothetical protein [Salinirubrum litoreum]|uniref:Uncharacterized protein n=1 Tax=Salinirubrum litoreum TaxID=1126234 RepID=A0ABD5R7E1_9EURY|nr:hypothetical protein [Salinirubrum litoreum]
MMLGNRIRGHCIRHSRLLVILVVLSILLATQGVAAAGGGGLEATIGQQGHVIEPGP